MLRHLRSVLRQLPRTLQRVASPKPRCYCAPNTPLLPGVVRKSAPISTGM